MSTRPDPLQRITPPDRLHYATGMLLDVEDFRDEQLYHRARLSRLALYFHGHGTGAGLRVLHEPAVEAGVDPALPEGREERLRVEPGLAIDPIGRLIEIPRSACLRLQRWYDAVDPGVLVQALAGPPIDGIVADVFVRFAACERGKTPAFAAGAFDALDAVAPSRLRDGYELELIPRVEDVPPEPESPWPDLLSIPDEQRLAALQEAVLDAWLEPDRDLDDGSPPALAEHGAGQATTDLLLARVILPASGDPPVRDAARDVSVDNAIRPISYSGGLLARLLGL